MSDQIVVGVGVAVVVEDRILLVRRGNEPYRDHWAVPGGKVRFGETLRQAAHREVLEETGLAVEIEEVIWAGEAIGDHGHIVLVDFLGRPSSPGPASAADDATELRWVRLDQADEIKLTPTMPSLIERLRQMT